MEYMSILNKAQQGFTLIELVIVIVILGILAAVALPKFVDLKDDARTAALKGVAGAISSGSSTNYAAKIAGKSTAATLGSTNVCSAATLGSIMTGGFPTGFVVNSAVTGNCSTTAVSVNCMIEDGGTPYLYSMATVLCAR